ncbi:unnamed protein product, partial [Staurois parvus]
WAPVPPPHAAARPVICHGPPVPPPHAAARSRVCHGSLYGLPLLLSPSPHSAMCHFQVSSHCWWVPFCHRVLADYGPPIAAARPVICHGPPYRLLMLLPGQGGIQPYICWTAFVQRKAPICCCYKPQRYSPV